MSKSLSLSQTAEELDDTITLSSSGTYSIGPITTISNGGYVFANTAISNSVTGPGPFTFSAGTNTSPWMTSTLGQVSAPKIKLDGEGADIEVNGWSLIDAIQKIEERLNILHPNEKLEEEWEELRALGEQYRKLEQHIKDKQATWDKLKAMPPPTVD
jgi:hypothetical protein